MPCGFFVLANEGSLPLRAEDYEVFCLFEDYFEAIEFWRDEDSGGWEEGRKVNDSSVGAVVAGLEMQKYFSESTPARRAGSRAHLHRAFGEVGDAHSKRNRTPGEQTSLRSAS